MSVTDRNFSFLPLLGFNPLGAVVTNFHWKLHAMIEVLQLYQGFPLQLLQFHNQRHGGSTFRALTS